MKRNFGKRKFVVAIIFIALLIVLLVGSSVASTVYPKFKLKPISGLPADDQTQFKVDISYAYAGPGPVENSYKDKDNRTMYAVSQYSSIVVLNSTRLPSTAFESCDAEIEIYNITITNKKDCNETFCYFFGTNYQPISSSQLLKLKDSITPFTRHYKLVIGDFMQDMKENESIVSSPIGSFGVYSNAPSRLGLWKDGAPDKISVEVNRIGYVTIKNDSTSVYVDQPDKPAVTAASLEKNGQGFLHNNLVPENKIDKIDKFKPSD